MIKDEQDRLTDPDGAVLVRSVYGTDPDGTVLVRSVYGVDAEATRSADAPVQLASCAKVGR